MDLLRGILKFKYSQTTNFSSICPSTIYLCIDTTQIVKIYRLVSETQLKIKMIAMLTYPFWQLEALPNLKRS